MNAEAEPEDRGGSRGIVVGIITCIALAVPVGSGFLAEHRARVCILNLVRIDGAKQQLALEKNLYPGLPVTAEGIVIPRRGYLPRLPSCPSGGSYAVGPVGENPECDSGLPHHRLVEISGDGVIYPDDFHASRTLDRMRSALRQFGGRLVPASR